MKTRFAAALLLLLSMFAHAQGLRFEGSDHPIAQRTSLHVPAKGGFPIRGEMTVRFDFMMFPGVRNGYLFRLQSGGKGQHPTIDFFYDGVASDNDFELIWTGQRFISSLRIPKTELDPLRQWTRIEVTLDARRDSVHLRIGDRYRCDNAVNLPDLPEPVLWFGMSASLIDVPSFAIRNLEIAGSGKQFRFPLDENNGTLARCTRTWQYGAVENPVWLINETFRWKKLRTLTSKQFLCVGYDKARQEVYAFDKDTIRFFNLTENTARKQAFRNPCPVATFLGTSFLDPRDGRIYAYEAYYEGELAGKVPAVARLNPEGNTWEAYSYETLPMQMHHHDQYVDTLRHRLMLFGGFGNRRYNGDFYAFDLDRRAWQRLPQPEGEKVWPRYFASMGYLPAEDKLFIFGGKGNEIGDQIVGGDYMYNLCEVDPNSLTVRKRWDIPWEGENCVAVRGMVFVEAGYFYTLCYPESRTDSELHLNRFAIRDGAREVLADPIPIYSDKITTNANLYYDDVTGRFIATVEESTDDVNSKVSIYTLTSPARPVMKSTVAHRRAKVYGTALALFLGLLLLTSYFVVLWLRERRRRTRAPVFLAPEKDKPNSILLFGGFKVLDKTGEDVSSRFTAKLRDMFLIILKDMEGGGTTSRKLSSTLWPEKEEEKSKNIRGVTANGLRKQLSMLDGIHLVFKDRKFNLEVSDEFYCDYLAFFEILRSKQPDMDKLVSIVSRGEFLKGETDPMFDRMKAEVERSMEPVLQAEMQRRYDLKQYRNAITCADALLAMDPLNDGALACTIRSLIGLDKEEEAVMKYRAFALQYRKDYGEDFPKSYDQMVLHPSPFPE